eukprot:3439702-Pleurochrysis_carterae.AAC.1
MAGGSLTSMLVTELLALSDAAMPGVLVLGRRKETNAQGLRWKGMPATLSPMVGETLAKAAGVSVAGGPAAPKPLERALQLLELEWQLLVGEGGAPEADDEESEQEAGVMLEE